MKKSLLLGLFPVSVFAVDLVVPPPKVFKTEFNLQIGYTGYKEEYLDKSWQARVGLDYRINYPFLVGGGGYFSSSFDIWLALQEARMKVRVPLFLTLKLDPYVGVQLGYAENKVLRKKKMLGGGVFGADLLYFVSGAHFGVSAGYSVYTDSRFDHFKAGFVVGF